MNQTVRVARLIDATAGVETPIAVVDGAVRETNMARMQALADRKGVRLRPHAKTHKSTEVARRQGALGAVGLTVSTLQEAETFVGSGIQDLLLAHIPVGGAKLWRLAAIAERCKRMAVAVDSVTAGVALPQSVEVMWEVDTGGRRLGTQPGRATVEGVRALLSAIGPHRFRGLLTHGGHAYLSANDADLRNAAEEETGGLLPTAEMLRSFGIAVRELSVGSTPTSRYWSEIQGATEFRPGTYVYGDANQIRFGSQQLDQCAFFVVATVVSIPEANRAVTDAGSKAISIDLRAPGLEGYGLVSNRPDLRLDRLSEEHGMLLSNEPIGLKIGDRVAIVPNHVCTTVNLHAEVLVVDEGGSPLWEPVDARGWRRIDQFLRLSRLDQGDAS